MNSEYLIYLIISSDNRGAAKKLKANLQAEAKDSSYVKASEKRSTESPKSEKKKEESDDEEELPDVVKLGEDGWKERYYLQKFHVSASDPQFRKQYVNCKISTSN